MPLVLEATTLPTNRATTTAQISPDFISVDPTRNYLTEVGRLVGDINLFITKVAEKKRNYF